MEEKQFAKGNNQVHISGRAATGFMLDHEVRGEEFYRVTVECLRWSGTADMVPVVVSSRIVDVGQDLTGQLVDVTGQYRSHNAMKDGKRKQVFCVFTKEFRVVEYTEDENKVFLDGYICREPVYRTTPAGRTITDVMLAVNRAYGKTDYIPCIAWGRTAQYVSRQSVGTRLNIEGRIQSREYRKTLGDTFEIRTAYEVSVINLDVAVKPPHPILAN